MVDTDSETVMETEAEVGVVEEETIEEVVEKKTDENVGIFSGTSLKN